MGVVETCGSSRSFAFGVQYISQNSSRQIQSLALNYEQLPQTKFMLACCICSYSLHIYPFTFAFDCKKTTSAASTIFRCLNINRIKTTSFSILLEAAVNMRLAVFRCMCQSLDTVSHQPSNDWVKNRDLHISNLEYFVNYASSQYHKVI